MYETRGEVHDTPVKNLILNTTQCKIKDVFGHAFWVNCVLTVMDVCR